MQCCLQKGVDSQTRFADVGAVFDDVSHRIRIFLVNHNLFSFTFVCIMQDDSSVVAVGQLRFLEVRCLEMRETMRDDKLGAGFYRQ